MSFGRKKSGDIRLSICLRNEEMTYLSNAHITWAHITYCQRENLQLLIKMTSLLIIETTTDLGRSSKYRIIGLR